MKLIHRSLSTPNTTGSKKRGHGIIYCFLYRCKSWQRFIGPAVSVNKIPAKIRRDIFNVAFGDNAIGIKENKVVVLRPFSTCIPSLSGTGIRFLEINNRELRQVFLNNEIALFRRSVFGNDYFEILVRLSG
ncbi:hypothetical protein SDC9_84990 [bioreactor metagenome]|uniref:Uncharacterized protein n=1 Tax=bioreactor metagenome TaxID=1076179 RepID=A0A644ZEP5_9ZZZZ